MDLGTKKIVMVIAPENFRDEEYFHTRESLEQKGIQVTTASTAKTAVSSVDKVKINVDKLLSEIHSEYDGIVFIGGSGAKIFVKEEKALSLAQEYFENGKIVAAICIAPLILANAGILTNKSVTIWEGARKELDNFAVDYTAKKVEVDENIITANGPHAAHKFGKKIAKSLLKG